MNHPRDWAKLALFYSQEIAMDVTVPGQEARDRVQRNARLLREACEAWISYQNWEPIELWAEIWKDHPEEKKRMDDYEKTKKGSLTIPIKSRTIARQKHG